jgi:hypothetical protein
MRLILLGAVTLATLGLPAPAATIFFTAPPVATGTFDVIVQAQDLFAGRTITPPELADGIVGFGFNVGVDPLLLTFDSADSGPLFDPATTAPGIDVLAAAAGFGIFDPVAEPLILATLHFTRIGSGPADIVISSDLSNSLQGLNFLNEPFAESIAGTVTVADVPEPATLAIAGVVLLALGILRRRVQVKA